MRTAREDGITLLESPQGGSRMMRVPALLLPMAVVAGLAGCQCCGVTERYADVVDDVSDHKPVLDRLYHPAYDLTRIGKPDWCCNRLNRWWCRRACRGDCTTYHGCCPWCLPPKPEASQVVPANHLRSNQPDGGLKTPPAPKNGSPPSPQPPYEPDVNAAEREELPHFGRLSQLDDSRSRAVRVE